MANPNTKELLDIFKRATQLAKAKNKDYYVEDITEEKAIELFKQAFPNKKFKSYDFIREMMNSKLA